ncbi:ABC transporter substrate-binding protein [Geodermatophilus sp. URMC 64]
MRARRVFQAALAVVVFALVACAPEGRNAPEPVLLEGTIRFAAYDFSENEVLVEVYAEAARRAGLPVVVQPGVATREVLVPALEQGKVDVVVDYLGTVEAFVRRGRPASDRTPEELHAALTQELAPRGVTVLAAAEAQDQNGFAVTARFAAEHRVRRLSDLAPLAGDLVLGAPPECPDRPLCLPGLREVYGLEFGRVVSLTSRRATVENLVAGAIDVGLLETTDARLTGASLLLLADDRSLQPHENIVPLVRSAVLDGAGDRLKKALDETTAQLTQQQVVALNKTVEVDGLTPQQAAARWWDAR